MTSGTCTDSGRNSSLSVGSDTVSSDPFSEHRDARKADGVTVSIAGYIIVLGNCWEFSIVTSAFSIPNGGTGGAIWMYVEPEDNLSKSAAIG